MVAFTRSAARRAMGNFNKEPSIRGLIEPYMQNLPAAYHRVGNVSIRGLTEPHMQNSSASYHLDHESNVSGLAEELRRISLSTIRNPGGLRLKYRHHRTGQPQTLVITRQASGQYVSKIERFPSTIRLVTRHPVSRRVVKAAVLSYPTLPQQRRIIKTE